LDFNEPIPPFEERFPNKLEGILESTRQTFDKKLLNPTVIDASAAYFNNIVRGHPFRNGNKRLAVLFTHVFVLLNNYDIDLSYKAMYNLALIIAEYSENGVSAENTKKGLKRIFERYIVKDL
jgi:death-on-curing protein